MARPRMKRTELVSSSNTVKRYKLTQAHNAGCNMPQKKRGKEIFTVTSKMRRENDILQSGGIA